MDSLHRHRGYRPPARLDDASCLRALNPWPCPIIPHEDFGADCCGCLVAIIGETTEYRCNECGAVIAAEDVQRIVMEMPSVEEICPHCGKVNQINGFSEVYAFVCLHCGQGVSLDRSFKPEI